MACLSGALRELKRKQAKRLHKCLMVTLITKISWYTFTVDNRSLRNLANLFTEFTGLFLLLFLIFVFSLYYGVNLTTIFSGHLDTLLVAKAPFW